MPRRATAIPVVIETGRQRIFASALDWPGWCRAAKTEEGALEALAAYAPRYEVAVEQAGLKLPANAGDSFEVVERVPGNATTDFGVPGIWAAAELDDLTAKQAKRLASLVDASWVVFDAVMAKAPAELRKGPRGGGRDRDKIADHVLGAESAYARQLGLKWTQPS